MADIYTPNEVPAEYNPEYLQEELRRIAAQLQAFEVPYIILVPQNVAPAKLQEGMVANADGTNWNPGAGAGLYEYVGAAWNKL